MAAFKVIWSPRAEKSFLKICDFIISKWTSREVDKFGYLTTDIITKIAKNPEMFVVSKRRKDIRKGFISKHTSLLYRIKSNRIELLLFWDNRQNPKKKKV